MFWEIFIMDVINGFLWGAILALGSAVAITYSKTCSKADRHALPWRPGASHPPGYHPVPGPPAVPAPPSLR